MPLKTMGVVLNTIEHPYAHLILFQYDEDAMSGTSPMCQLLKAIHNYQPYYAMKRTNIMPCKWYDVYDNIPRDVFTKYGLIPAGRICIDPNQMPTKKDIKALFGIYLTDAERNYWKINGDVVALECGYLNERNNYATV